jgi:transposase-like protein
LARIRKIKGGASPISVGTKVEPRLNAQMWDIQHERLPRTKTATAELPPPETKRWTPRRKASVVKAVISGMMSLEEVYRGYGLSVDEFRSWHDAMQRHGMRGLYTTKLQKYRCSPPGRLTYSHQPLRVSVTPT